MINWLLKTQKYFGEKANCAILIGYLIQERIDRLRVFAGIGTVSDSMPLLYENRQLVRDALSICWMVYNSDGRRSTDAIVKSIEGSQPYRLAFRGLYELLQLCAENGLDMKPSWDCD